MHMYVFNNYCVVAMVTMAAMVTIVAMVTTGVHTY